jgi:hypothetical protein
VSYRCNCGQEFEHHMMRTAHLADCSIMKREAAIQKIVEALGDIMRAALNGDETSTELNCHHLAQEALEEWRKVNE